jgi:uncharacterized protein YggE
MKTAIRAAALALALTASAAPAAFAQSAPAANSMFATTTFHLSAYGETRIAP